MTSTERYDAAIALRDEGKTDEAIAHLTSLVEDEPTYALGHSALAVLYQKAGKFDEAIEHAKTIVRLNPDDPFSYTQYSVICQRCGRIAEAEDALAKQAEMNG